MRECVRCLETLSIDNFRTPIRNGKPVIFRVCNACTQLQRAHTISISEKVPEYRERWSRRKSEALKRRWATDPKFIKIKEDAAERRKENRRKYEEQKSIEKVVEQAKEYPIDGLSFDGCRTQDEKEIRIMYWAMETNLEIGEGDEWNEFVLYALDAV